MPALFLLLLCTLALPKPYLSNHAARQPDRQMGPGRKGPDRDGLGQQIPVMAVGIPPSNANRAVFRDEQGVR